MSTKLLSCFPKGVIYLVAICSINLEASPPPLFKTPLAIAVYTFICLSTGCTLLIYNGSPHFLFPISEFPLVKVDKIWYSVVHLSLRIKYYLQNKFPFTYQRAIRQQVCFSIVLIIKSLFYMWSSKMTWWQTEVIKILN